MATKCNINYKGNTYSIDDAQKILEYHYIVKDSIVEPVVETNNDPVESTVKSLKDFKKPSLNIKFISDKVLLEKDNALELKYKQDALKKDFKELKKVIACLWN